MQKVYSAREIHDMKTIYWIKSYKTLLKYMHFFGHILKPVMTGQNTGKRYYVSEDNLQKFVRMFENNELA